MNKPTLQLAQLYSTDQNSFKDHLNTFDTDQLKQMIVDLLHLNLTDPNFSSLAESIPLNLAGYESHPDKHGYDGFIGESYENALEYLEQKPDKTNSTANKLNGGGGFADYTIKRWENDMGNGDKLKLMISGFVNGTLIYAYKVPHNHQPLMDRLKNETTRLINKGGRVVPTFSYIHYQTCTDIELVYRANNFDDFKDYMSKPFFNFVKSL